MVEKPPARRRGRPRGSRKVEKEDKEDYLINMEEESPEDNEEEVRVKKDLNLRKRERGAKKVIDKSSDENQKLPIKEDDELKPVEVTINIPRKPSPAPKAPTETIVTPPPAPKKRGRKKKVQPEENTLIAEVVTTAANPQQVKVYTVPKAQTYDNYHKYYDKIMEETKEG